MKRIYLATPYSDKSKRIMIWRYLAATAATARLLSEGNLVYSPITHGHHLPAFADLPADFEFWRQHCLSFLEHWATELRVLQIRGWQESIGVQAEIAFATEHGIPVVMQQPGGEWS